MRPLSLKVEGDATLPFDRWLARELAERLERPVSRSLARRAIRLGWITVGGKIELDRLRSRGSHGHLDGLGLIAGSDRVDRMLPSGDCESAVKSGELVAHAEEFAIEVDRGVERLHLNADRARLEALSG